MSTQRIFHLISLLAGLTVLAVTLSGTMKITAQPCGGLVRGYAPIMAFELARSTSDIQKIFGDQPGTCRTAMQTDMDRVNRLDNILFIPAYGAFLFFFFLGMRNRGRELSRNGAVIAVIACLADYLENMCLFHLSSAPDNSRQWISTLSITTEVKWIGLGIAGILAGLLIARSRTIASRIGQLVCNFGIVFTLLSVFVPAWAALFMVPAIALGWIVMLIVNTNRVLRPAAA